MLAARHSTAQAALAQLAAAQDGLVSRSQARRLGWTDEAIAGALASHRWQRVFRGVYATFSGPLPWATRLRAALLRAGPGAVASHETAAALHGLREPDPGETIEVTVAADRRVRGEPGLRIHYAHRIDATRHPALDPPRTRVEDTVLDLVDRARTSEEVTGWVTRACQRRRTTPARIAEALSRRKKIAHRGLVEALVGQVAAGAESPLEIRYLTDVERAHGLPPSVRQRRVSGRRTIWVDADLEAFSLRIELDGRVGHVEEGAFRDRRRDNAATVEGKATLRYGHAEVFGTPCLVATEVARVCQDRGWTGRPRPCGPTCPMADPRDHEDLPVL
jgi:hypothetical protein